MQKKSKICLIDLGSGNVGSVKNILKYLNVDFCVTNTESDIKKSSHLILPGVGSFGSLMKKINDSKFDKIFEEEVIMKKKNYLGICVGMQILAKYGHEFGKFKGVGAIDGEVRKIDSKDFPLPHIGWNNIEIKKDSLLFSDINNNADFYFVNSYALKCNHENDILSTTNYNEKFVSSIQKENIFGVQFHPEKSQQDGIKLIKNFVSI